MRWLISLYSTLFFLLWNVLSLANEQALIPKKLKAPRKKDLLGFHSHVDAYCWLFKDKHNTPHAQTNKQTTKTKNKQKNPQNKPTNKNAQKTPQKYSKKNKPENKFKHFFDVWIL